MGINSNSEQPPLEEDIKNIVESFENSKESKFKAIGDFIASGVSGLLGVGGMVALATRPDVTSFSLAMEHAAPGAIIGAVGAVACGLFYSRGVEHLNAYSESIMDVSVLLHKIDQQTETES